MKTRHILCSGCQHLPFPDPRAINLFKKFISLIQPSEIILQGDVCDFEAISTFVKNYKRRLNFQHEIDQVKLFLQQVRALAPKAKMLYQAGNHEHRLEAYLSTRAYELSTLTCLSVPELLELDKIKCAYQEYGKYYYITDNFVATHGTRVCSSAGQSAMAEMKLAGCSGVSFHTHRRATVYETNTQGTKVWVEGGCLADLNQAYCKTTMNWQQGFVLLTVNDDKVYPELIPIDDGVAYFRGLEYK